MLDPGFKIAPAMEVIWALNQENSIEFLEPRAFSFLVYPPRVDEFDPGIQTSAVTMSNYGCSWR
jgi:hypothetical protein